MPLDNFDTDKSNEMKAQSHDGGALAQFRQSFAYEASREWAAVGQVFGTELVLPDAPIAADTVLGHHAQMLGAAAADLVPALGLALVSRYVFGGKYNARLEEGFSVRSPLGLSPGRQE